MAPMELRGAVQRDVPLLVVALAEEAAGLDDTFPVLITGMGKLRAGTAVTGLLLQSGPPSVVNNIGTAGALRPGLTGIHEIATVPLVLLAVTVMGEAWLARTNSVTVSLIPLTLPPLGVPKNQRPMMKGNFGVPSVSIDKK